MLDVKAETSQYCGELLADRRSTLSCIRSIEQKSQTDFVILGLIARFHIRSFQ